MPPTAAPHEHDSSAAPPPADYIRPLWRRKWLILAITLLATLATLAFFLQKPKRYEASTKVFFQNVTVAQLINPNAGSGEPDRNLVNQATLLLSRDVATNVARRIGFEGDPAALLGDVTAVPSEGSDFILIRAAQETPEGAADVANGFARAFIEIRTSRLRREIQTQEVQTAAQLRRLPRTPETAEERANLSATIRQLRLARNLPSASAQQVDPARPPAEAVAPRPVRAAAFAFLLSLLAGIGLAYVLERLDRRMNDIDEVGEAYDLPVLAAIPELDDPTAFHEGRPAIAHRLHEPFRTLRANVELAALDRRARKILVVSASPGEGKSTIVRNLALTYRESGLRVAVVDSDLRQPTLAKLFAVDGAAGLTQVLTGQTPLAEGLQRVAADVEGLETLARLRSAPTAVAAPAPGQGSNGHHDELGCLQVLTSGTQPANPPAVLAAQRTRAVLDEIAAAHDVVVVDSPPLLVVSDAVSLIAQMDAVVVVARVGQTTRDEAAGVMDVLRRVPEANVLGVVVNGVDARESAGPAAYYGY
jgi:receptor protein-tyrosine kinase